MKARERGREKEERLGVKWAKLGEEERESMKADESGSEGGMMGGGKEE